MLPPVTRLGRSNLKRSNRLVLLIGVFLAIVAFVGIAFILQSPGGSSGTPAVPTTAMTVIATRDIPLGVPVQANMLKTEVRNLDERKPNAFTSPELIIGSITRKPITTGAQLSAEDFDGGGGEILDLQVPPGMRAIAVSVDQISGVGTVIKTGDYVDMLVAITGDDKFPVVELDEQTDTITVVQGVNSTSIKMLLQGMQVIGTLLPTPTTAAAPPAEGAPPADQPGTTLSDRVRDRHPGGHRPAGRSDPVRQDRRTHHPRPSLRVGLRRRERPAHRCRGRRDDRHRPQDPHRWWLRRHQARS